MNALAALPIFSKKSIDAVLYQLIRNDTTPIANH